MRSSLFLALVGVGLLSASAARAEYSVCNKTSYTLNAAIGYADGERLTTRGWWRLRSGQCKIVLPDQVKPASYFIYAESIPGHRGAKRAWSGETPLCVENNGFFTLRNPDVCRDDPTRQRSFLEVKVTAAANGKFQSDFAEATVFSVYTAEIAGLQRLLQDVGLPVRAIDGSNDRDTQRLIEAYKQKRGLAATAKNDEVIDALIEDVNQREQNLGLVFCNKTEAQVWSSVAQADARQTYVSRGWWKLDPGECSKVVKGEALGDHVYVYGVIDDGPTERRLTGGDKKLCTDAVKFEISNDSACDDQDFDTALYRRVPVTGGAATFEFTPDQFVAAPAPKPAPRAP